MKFCDKLQKIRKENNITQEGLADRLNVSRQAVSKWESGAAYPDIEKLIQISKIFNVSLDELINDNLDKNVSISSKKISFMEMINNLLTFISKSVNMFWSMKFIEKIKCLFEMALLILIIVGVAMLSTSVIVELIRRIFMFLPSDFLHFVCYLFESLLFSCWIVIGLIVVVKLFKTRYLDYYLFVNDNNVSERVVEEPIKELREKKEYLIVIRDPEHSSLNIFKKISKIFIILFKFICFLIIIPLILFFIICVICFIFSLFCLLDGMFFNGLSLAIFGVIIFTYLIIEFIYNLLFNRNHAVRRIFIVFIFGMSLIGVGLGLSFTALSNFSFERNTIKEVNTHVIDMRDDLLITSMFYDMYNDDIIIDNSLDNIKLEITSYANNSVYLYSYDNNRFKAFEFLVEYDNIGMYKDILMNLKNKKVVSYDTDYEVKMYISQDNYLKLKDNVHSYILGHYDQ